MRTPSCLSNRLDSSQASVSARGTYRLRPRCKSDRVPSTRAPRPARAPTAHPRPTDVVDNQRPRALDDARGERRPEPRASFVAEARTGSGNASSTGMGSRGPVVSPATAPHQVSQRLLCQHGDPLGPRLVNRKVRDPRTHERLAGRRQQRGMFAQSRDARAYRRHAGRRASPTAHRTVTPTTWTPLAPPIAPACSRCVIRPTPNCYSSAPDRSRAAMRSVAAVVWVTRSRTSARRRS